MDKLTKVKFYVFSILILIAVFSYVFHILPYRAVWLWFPILALVNHWLDWYAKRQEMVLSDEMTRQRSGISAWWTFQATIILIFLSIVYYDMNRTYVDPRYILAYLVGYMGIIYIAVYIYYNIKQRVWD